MPAINAASESEFCRRARTVRSLGSPWVQIDVSDGIYGVPKNFASPAITARELRGLSLDIHLMVSDVVRGVGEWKGALPRRITIHSETVADPRPVLESLGPLGIERGIALAPTTTIERVRPHLSSVDFVLFVAVPPGRSGQTFDPRTVERVRALRASAPLVDIGVDGGVTAALVPSLRAAGATTIIVASAIFSVPDPQGAYEQLKQLVEKS